MRLVRRSMSAVVLAAVLALALTGCGRKPLPANRGVTGKNVVLILTKDSRFKTEVIARVSAGLTAKHIRVLTDRTRAAGSYRAADFLAVVYIPDYWAQRGPRGAKRYHRDNGEAPNIVFLVTAGDAGVRISKPFDAITSPSKQNEADRVAAEILSRIERLPGR